MEQSINELIDRFVKAKRTYHEDKDSNNETLEKDYIRSKVDLDEAIRKAIIKEPGKEEGNSFIVVRTINGAQEYFSNYTNDGVGDLEHAEFSPDKDQALEALLSRVLDVIKSEAYHNHGRSETLDVYIVDNDESVLSVEV